eukprot:225490_1
MELSQSDHDGEDDVPCNYNTPSKKTHSTQPSAVEISAAAPESPAPPLPHDTVLPANETNMLEYIGITMPSTHVLDKKKPGKLSMSSLQDRFTGATSNNKRNTKQSKHRNNDIYKSSPEQSEIKEQEDSAPSKRSKSKGSKHASKRLNYKFSSSDTPSIMDIDNEDSSSYEFESITKLTTITNIAPETVNTCMSEADTMIENDTLMSMSPMNSHLSTSIASRASTNRISLKLNQTSFKLNAILASHSKYKGIENPFYHSEDGQDADDDDEEEDREDLESNSSYYNNYNWYQPFKPQQMPKALAYSHSNKMFTPKHFVPQAAGDKVRMSGASHPLVSRSKRSVPSSHNSMRAQGSSCDSEEIHRRHVRGGGARDYNPFRQHQKGYPSVPHLSNDDTVESDGTISTPPPYPHSEYYNVSFGSRRCPPPHAYNHYSHSELESDV